MYKLKELQERRAERQEAENGFYVPCRPVDGPFIDRLKDAWMVLIGKADAFRWPHGQ